MDDLRLSICIATYNRAGFIGATLESIIPQVTEEVEILVVDGASPDNTAEIVRKYQSSCPQLRYVRLETKGGVDQDYCRAVELARGEYCWLFTDDDALKPGSIQTVLSAIQQDHYGLIIVNAELRSDDLLRCFLPRVLPFRSNQVYLPRREDQERFLGDVGGYLSFIGCVVINRRLWNERDRASYLGTEFVHVGVIFQELLPEKNLVVAEPYIAIRLGNSQWTSWAFKIWIIRWPQLIWSFAPYSAVAKRRVCPRYPAQQLWKLFYYRAMASYSMKEYAELVAPYSASCWSRLPARLIASLPGWLANGFFIGYARLRRRYWMLKDLRVSPFYYRRCLTARGAARGETKRFTQSNSGGTP